MTSSTEHSNALLEDLVADGVGHLICVTLVRLSAEVDRCTRGAPLAMAGCICKRTKCNQ